MQEQVVLQKFLQRKYSELRASNPQYSLRAFSRKIGMNPGALSGIMNGKRNASSKIVQRIADRLLLDPQERSEIYANFRVASAVPRPEAAEYRKLSAAQFRITSEWEHFAILSLMRVRDFKNDPQWIAQRLGLTLNKVKEAMDRLAHAGMIQVGADGELSRSSPQYRTTDDIADMSLRRSHEQSLDLARKSLENDTVADRDHTWVMFAMDPKKMKLAKEMIRRFQDELAELVETGDQTEVYRMSMHFFPITKKKEN